MEKTFVAQTEKAPLWIAELPRNQRIGSAHYLDLKFGFVKKIRPLNLAQKFKQKFLKFWQNSLLKTVLFWENRFYYKKKISRLDQKLYKSVPLPHAVFFTGLKTA